MQGRDGDLYGTTERGGAFDRGAVFRITAAGSLTILHSFAGIDGESPDGPVVQGRDGNFYGTTFFGGAADEGTVYRLTPSGTVTVRYSFTGGADGGAPTGAIVEAADGSLYGTTFGGGDFSSALGGGRCSRCRRPGCSPRFTRSTAAATAATRSPEWRSARTAAFTAGAT